MDHQIKTVAILGGGTAGWLSAAYLQRALPHLKITLVESEVVGRIGVGEATVPTLRATLDFLGFQEDEWMPRCQASFKSAIKFVNWRHGPERPEFFYHPFHHQRNNLLDLYGLSYFMEIDGRVPLAHHWLSEKFAGASLPDFAYACSPNSALCDENRAPRPVEKSSRTLNYAYHFDAQLFAGFIREKAMQRGVERWEGKLGRVEFKENGFLGSLVMEDGRKLEADFFVDCSGFRSLLTAKALETPFLNQGKYLLCDSAIGIQPAYDNREQEFSPYTSAIALDHGWRWNIPLQHRLGTGYVFSSQTTDRASADREIRKHVGVARCEKVDANHIDMRVGYHPEVWRKNCVAIGLAGGFIEPLESTSIFLTEFQLFQLVRHFPHKDCAPALARQFNRKYSECFLEIRDFVLMHYALSQRSDTAFWREARSASRIPDSLQEKLELFRERLPLDSDLRHHLFHAFNYTCLLAGFGQLPGQSFAALGAKSKAEGQTQLAAIERQTEQFLRELPTLSHYSEEIQKRWKANPVPHP